LRAALNDAVAKGQQALTTSLRRRTGAPPALEPV
jgi:hypothetical protein